MSSILLGSGIKWSHDSSIFNFLGNSQTFQPQLHHFKFPRAIYKHSTFFTSSSTFLFSLIHLSVCVCVCVCVFHWIFIGRTDIEAEAPILWPSDAKNWLTGKDHDAGKDWRQEKWTTEDEMVGRLHWLDGHEFEQAPGVGDGQGSLAAARNMSTNLENSVMAAVFNSSPKEWQWQRVFKLLYNCSHFTF